jgi:peptidyl-prolyl cis-trans isomerase B (cyclophilin B)
MNKTYLFVVSIMALAILIGLSSCQPAQAPTGSSVVPSSATAPDSGSAQKDAGTADKEAAAAPANPLVDPSAPLTRAAAPPPGKKAYPAPTQKDVTAAKAAGTRTATIRTKKGTIEVALYGADAPLSVANFVKLARGKFYNGLTFHRVEPGFVIQGGDPLGTGAGGPGYEIRLEISPKLRHVAGALAWARTQDPNSAGSQFYITLAPTPSLDDQYAVFGKVTKGMDVVKQIAVGDKITSIVVK